MKKYYFILFLGCFFSLTDSSLLAQPANCPLKTRDFPINTKNDGNNYSWSAGLYMPSQIGGAQTINSISYRLDNTYGNAGTFSDIRVYLRETTVTNYASSPGYPGTTGFTQVYGGSVTYSGTNGVTYTFTLSSPFIYSGTKNLELLIENRGGAASGGYSDAEPWFDRTNDAGSGNFCGKRWSNTSWASAISGSASQPFNLAIYTGKANVFCGAFPLSVSFKNFTSQCDDGHINLEWATISEKNNDYFIIDYSENGTDWAEIAQIKGHGTTHEEQNYSFKHRNLTSSTVYYRLKQVDFDGTEEYLQTIASNCQAKGTALVTPNPSRGEFMVYNINKGDQLTVYSLLGEVVGQTTAESNFANFDLSQYQSGVYMIHIQSGDNNQVIKVSVQ